MAPTTSPARSVRVDSLNDGDMFTIVGKPSDLFRKIISDNFRGIVSVEHISTGDKFTFVGGCMVKLVMQVQTRFVAYSAISWPNSWMLEWPSDLAAKLPELKTYVESHVGSRMANVRR